jgi:hypothetical protein
MHSVHTYKPGVLGFEYSAGWKYYKQIKKKAMEQEFSWSGLFISLSIAFFIVLAAAIALNLFYNSIKQTTFSQNLKIEYIYQLENINEYTVEHYIQFDQIDKEKVREMRKNYVIFT